MTQISGGVKIQDLGPPLRPKKFFVAGLARLERHRTGRLAASRPMCLRQNGSPLLEPKHKQLEPKWPSPKPETLLETTSKPTQNLVLTP